MASKIRELITLECPDCKQRNYDCDKNKRNILHVLNTKSIAVFAESIRFTRRQNR